MREFDRIGAPGIRGRPLERIFSKVQPRSEAADAVVGQSANFATAAALPRLSISDIL
jgi:hypothetical protein